ncbi:malate synthase A [Georgenia yuyongxinii]|uniref:Malate synthase n=1 Tax=Georgenia yuyongxinii TaxID=2589797 RepID=A0A552WNX8_9MICO|nr:malate synthase A [Georgenia yuyongxinii]TRW44193.1 malate synthase A [Georgenia yuyongxinii]
MTIAAPTTHRLAVAAPRRAAAASALHVVAPSGASAPSAPSAPSPASAHSAREIPAPRGWRFHTARAGGAPAVEVVGPAVPGAAEILTPAALAFLAELHTRFAPRRADLLAERQRRRRGLADGAGLDFRAETAHIRRDPSWQVPPPAPGLEDRRVEITGPTERKMTINALNSGAKVWLADLEDANTPHFANVVDGQVNLRDAIRRDITFTGPTGKGYALHDGELATIVVRPRGWHLTEKHLRVDGQVMVGGLVDFGLYFFHNAEELLRRGAGPYFYLAKLENHVEARLWNDVFTFAEDYLGLERGTIRATVLIETITAAFEMEEILYELREHSAGLNAGRWDYIFSVIKNFRTRPEFVLPDRADVTMTVPFMRAYTELLVRTCHRRGAHAIGGMSAFIPSKDPERDAVVFAKVREDKSREAAAGFDGSWVAHPGMVGAVAEVFDATLGFMPHQIGRTRDDVRVGAAELLDIAATPGAVTAEGLRTNVAVALRYLEAWLEGRGAVGIFGLMEDAATAEISRSQVWQWIHHGTALADGRTVTRALVEEMLREETAALLGEAAEPGAASTAGRASADGAASQDAARRGRITQAAELFAEVALGEEYPTFLTVPAYANRVD